MPGQYLFSQLAWAPDSEQLACFAGAQAGWHAAHAVGMAELELMYQVARPAHDHVKRVEDFARNDLGTRAQYSMVTATMGL
jgi:hypothetical protein